jgi:hypothetical protein
MHAYTRKINELYIEVSWVLWFEYRILYLLNIRK